VFYCRWVFARECAAADGYLQESVLLQMGGYFQAVQHEVENFALSELLSSPQRIRIRTDRGTKWVFTCVPYNLCGKY
jgi:hypothetical protein